MPPRAPANASASPSASSTSNRRAIHADGPRPTRTVAPPRPRRRLSGKVREEAAATRPLLVVGRARRRSLEGAPRPFGPEVLRVGPDARQRREALLDGGRVVVLHFEDHTGPSGAADGTIARGGA